MAVSSGIVSRSGTWYTYGDIRLGQGRENARDFLESNPELAHEIEDKVREKLGLPRLKPVGEPKTSEPEQVRKEPQPRVKV